MTRQEATSFARARLTEFGLLDWHIKLVTYSNDHSVFLGKCDSRAKIIYLNSHHIDTNPTILVEETINHEIAHALTPGHSHDSIWAAKAKELGANPTECATYALNPAAIEAIRSGDILEIESVEVKKTILVPTEVTVNEPVHK